MEDAHYLSRPDQLRFLPGVPAALRRLAEADVALIVVTNQSGIARGMLNEDDYGRVAERLDAMLRAEQVHLSASYHCPHHPDFSAACDCRKPALGMYQRAVREHGLDATRSLFVGDRWRDVQPALAFRGFGVLVPASGTAPEDLERARAEASVAGSLEDAVARFLDR